MTQGETAAEQVLAANEALHREERLVWNFHH